MTVRTPVTVLLTVLILLSAGCASTSEKAKTGVAPEYPENRYLVATGYGDTAVDAGREARAAMAAIFSSIVYSETMAEATSAFGLDGEEQFQKQVDSTVQVISSVALEGVKIVDIGTDPKTGAARALAVLDRRQAAARWLSELAAVGDRLFAEMTVLPSVSGDLFRLATLNRIVALSLQQEALMSRLRVVGASTAMAEPADMRSVAEELAALRRKAALAVMLDGEQAEAAVSGIKDRLSREGLLLVEDTSTAAGIVSGTVVLQHLNIPHPTARFVRVVINADIVDVQTGITLRSVTAKVRKAHADELEATRMAVSAASAAVAAEIAEALGQLGWAEP